MRVQLIGMGIVGSTIANNLLQHKKPPSLLSIVDINKDNLEGQYKDLRRVIVQNKLDTKLFMCYSPITTTMDYNIICAGCPTDYDSFEVEQDAHDALFRKNYPIVKDIVNKIRAGVIIIVTNPSTMIAKKLVAKFPNKMILYAGDIVDSIEDGREILSLKGHTNWGIATEVLNMITKR